MGAELVRFSPIHDRELPEELDGLLLSGGYPELNGEALEENQEMCTRIREVILDGMPCLAECGGFMYLHQEMEDMEGKQRRVCGDPWKGLPDTEAEPVRLYHPYGKTGYRTW